MSNIQWQFEDCPTLYSTPAEKLELTVAKLRIALNLHPEHPIKIQDHAQSNGPSAQRVPLRSGDGHTDQSATVQEAPRPRKARTTTTELRSVRVVLDDPANGSVESALAD